MGQLFKYSQYRCLTGVVCECYWSVARRPCSVSNVILCGPSAPLCPCVPSPSLYQASRRLPQESRVLELASLSACHPTGISNGLLRCQILPKQGYRRFAAMSDFLPKVLSRFVAFLSKSIVQGIWRDSHNICRRALRGEMWSTNRLNDCGARPVFVLWELSPLTLGNFRVPSLCLTLRCGEYNVDLRTAEGGKRGELRGLTLVIVHHKELIGLASHTCCHGCHTRAAMQGCLYGACLLTISKCVWQNTWLAHTSVFSSELWFHQSSSVRRRDNRPQGAVET